MPETIPTRTIRRPAGRAVKTVEADICVLGAGISGVSAALEAAKLGRKVVLVDGAPSLGGQAIGSIIGTLIGLYTHGPNAYQITHGIADDLIRELTAEGSLLRHHHSTVTFQYDEVRLARWMESKVEAAGHSRDRRCRADRGRFPAIDACSTSSSPRASAPCACKANGYVDSSGDASLSYEAGLEVREPEEQVYGTLNFLIENYDLNTVGELDMKEVHARLIAKGKEYGLVRHDGWLMHFPGKNFMLANISHIETPLDPAKSANMVFEGRRQADNIIRFLKAEFPRIFANARVRVYGNPGLRQTRWIVSSRQLTLDDIRKTERPADAAARCSWYVELHDTKELVHWERFKDGHVYYIPLSCMVPKDADNIVASGRCVDADSHALSAIRVMGPCIAMGTAAAHALDLAGKGSVHEIDLKKFQQRLVDNLERTE